MKLKQKPEYSLPKGSISECLIIVVAMTKVFDFWFKQGKQNVFLLRHRLQASSFKIKQVLSQITLFSSVSETLAPSYLDTEKYTLQDWLQNINAYDYA